MMSEILNLLREAEGGPEPAADGHGVGGETGTGLVVSCPMAGQASGQLWPLSPLASVSSVSRLGSQPWECADGNCVLAPDLAHLTHTRNLETVLVIGHSDCDVVADAYDEYVAADRAMAAGVEARIEPLVAMVRDAIESGDVDTDCPRETLLARLVEYIVTRQVEFLVENDSVTATIAGYVHDTNGLYGGFPETPYLVSVDGEQHVGTLQSRVPADRDVAVGSVRS